MAYKEKIYIYKITSPKGRVYIGQTNNPERRKVYYRTGNCKGQTRLYASFKKYGVDKHSFEIIEDCDVSAANERERYWQEHYDVLTVKGLNCRYQKSNDRTGRLSPETIAKIRESNIGKKISDETRAIWSKQRKGRRHTIESKIAISKGNKGKKVSEETRKKMSAARIGFKPSPETIEKYRMANIGKKLSLETRKKLIDNNKNSKKVIDIVSGKIYPSVRQASIDLGIHYGTFRNWINGISPNKSNIRYV